MGEAPQQSLGSWLRGFRRTKPVLLGINGAERQSSLLVGRFELVVLATWRGTVGDCHFYDVGDSPIPVGVGGHDLEAM